MLLEGKEVFRLNLKRFLFELMAKKWANLKFLSIFEKN